MGPLVLQFLMAMFVTLNLMAPIASNKVAIVFGVTFAVGSLLVGISYGLLDVVNDWKGKATARQTVVVALAVRAVFFLVVLPIVFLLPTSHATEGFDAFLGMSARLFFAGWVSLWLGGLYVNTPLFSNLRERFKGRWFILRYLVTSFPTILVGSIVYGILGFYGTKVDVFALIWGTVVARVLISIVLVPVVALVRIGVRHLGNTDN